MAMDNTIDFKTATREQAESYMNELESMKAEVRGEEYEQLKDFIEIEGERFRKELHEKADEEYANDAAKYVKKASAEAPTEQPKYTVAKRLEFAVDEEGEDCVLEMSRQEYVFHFKAHARNTARAALEMCRIVYSAHKMLSEEQFERFCTSVGYKDTSSTIRKFITIGKVYPRLINYAESLPIAWTSIYQLTQIPADDFERCIATGFAFNKMTGSELKELVDKTRDANDIRSPFKTDKKALRYRVANVYFTKLPDDTDFRLLQKAFDEVAARLPVRLEIDKQVVERFEQRRQQRYEVLKRERKDVAVKPQEWDYGVAANEVHKPRQAAA